MFMLEIAVFMGNSYVLFIIMK